MVAGWFVVAGQPAARPPPPAHRSSRGTVPVVRAAPLLPRIPGPGQPARAPLARKPAVDTSPHAPAVRRGARVCRLLHMYPYSRMPLPPTAPPGRTYSVSVAHAFLTVVSPRVT